MRKLLWAVLIAAGAWSTWWFIGSTIKERAITAWFAERRAAGWVAEVESLKVAGFPNRFDTRIKGLALADPSQDWAWSAPELEILALSYQPNRIIAVWPHEQDWSNHAGTVHIRSEDMRGSVSFVPSTTLALDALTVDIKGLQLDGPGWSAGLESAIFATRRSAGAPVADNAHDLALTAANLALPPFWKDLADRSDTLPDVFSTGELQATLRFDSPWDRHAIETRNPLLTGFHLDKLRLVWGDLQLDAIGDIAIDRRGYFDGTLQLRARNWQEILQVFVDSGSISPATGDVIRQGMGLLASISGDRRTLDAPLSFSNGDAYLGPVWIGYAPRLVR